MEHCGHDREFRLQRGCGKPGAGDQEADRRSQAGQGNSGADEVEDHRQSQCHAAVGEQQGSDQEADGGSGLRRQAQDPDRGDRMTSSPAVMASPAPMLEESLGESGVLRLTLNRPKERNALSSGLLNILLQAIRQAEGNDAVRAVVIAGNGPGFCAGHDLREMTSHRSDPDGGRRFYEQLFATCTRLMTAIRRSPLVFIAEVGGTATAAGCQLVASCDMAVASTTARFGVNGIDSGLFCSTPMVAVARNLPHKLTMELLTTGRLMSAEEAKSAGLVNRVVEPEALRQESDALAARLVKRSRAVLALGKRAFYAQIEMSFDEAYGFTEQVIVDNLMMDDAEEGIAAFLARRSPVWKDR